MVELVGCLALVGIVGVLLALRLQRRSTFRRPYLPISVHFPDSDDDLGFTSGDVDRFLNDPVSMWRNSPGQAARISSMLEDVMHDEDEEE